MLLEDEKRKLAGQARTFHERENGPTNVVGHDSVTDSEELLHEWKAQFPDEESFQKRLAMEGLTESNIRRHATKNYWPEDLPFPDWITEIERLIDYIENSPCSNRPNIPSSEDLPFDDILTPIAMYAYDRLSDNIDLRTISPLIEWLLERLERHSVRVLYTEFKSFVEYKDPELIAADPDDFADPPTEYYQKFVNEVFDGAFKALCIEYPVLARNFIQITEQWITTVEETYQRLQDDLNLLHEHFQVDGAVMELEPLTEDTHAGGRVPVRVSLESGNIIYKPRPVEGGASFYEILNRLDNHLSTPKFETPNYLPRDSYGWMEFIEYEDLPDNAAVEKYYERAGALLCFTYVLNFTDCSLENLIVSRANPVLVDGETLLHPHVGPKSLPARTELANEIINSVLLSGLLPSLTGEPGDIDGEQLATALAGLGTRSGTSSLSNRSRSSIKAINTDVMSVTKSKEVINRSTNTPTFDAKDYPPENHINSLVSGFERTYETIRELHDSGLFLTEIVTPDLVTDVKNRLLYRPTQQYNTILESATDLAPLRNGVWFTVKMESLAALYFHPYAQAESYWPMYAAERKALRRLDIPRFSSYSDRETIYHDNKPLEATADTSGYELLRHRLDEMDAADKRRQAWLIRQSYRATETPTTDLPCSTTTTANRFLDEALSLFDDVLQSNNGHGWVSVTPAGQTFSLTRAGPSLYYGRSGIALAAAAIYQVTENEEYRNIVEEALKPVINTISDDTSLGFGGMKGVGSPVYALSVAAELVDEETYRPKARKAIRQVTREKIADDDTFDVVEGSAGTLLALLAYYDRFGDEEALNRALVCGERLLQGRMVAGDYRVWKTTQDTPSTGFAHGSSGIAYALGRLGAAADEPRFIEAAHEALSFESELFSSNQTNWMESPEYPDYQDRWCHGRTGIALSRIGLAKELGDESLLVDAEAALSETANATPAPFDNVCCGNFGRVEALIEGSRHTDLDRTTATELAGRCLARRDRDGALALPGHDSSFVNPTFFNGLSGVVYTLLRSQEPDTLPCALLLE